MTAKEIEEKLKENLTEKRYAHTLSVAKKAREMAELYGVCANKAYLAGLMHDCAKCMTEDELLSYIQMYDIEMDSVAKASPQLWHSYVGAYVARDVYGIEDEEIFDAVYYHTTGREGMSTLCAIIYLADAIEEGRNYSGVDSIRKKAETSLWDAVGEYAKSSIEFITKKGRPVHPDTQRLNDAINRRKK